MTWMDNQKAHTKQQCCVLDGVLMDTLVMFTKQLYTSLHNNHHSLSLPLPLHTVPPHHIVSLHNGTTCPVHCTHTQRCQYMHTLVGGASTYSQHRGQMAHTYIHTYTIVSYTCVHNMCITYLLVGDRKVSSAFIDAGNSTRVTMTQALSFIFPADVSATA